jgi:hypothetical protein
VLLEQQRSPLFIYLCDKYVAGHKLTHPLNSFGEQLQPAIRTRICKAAAADSRERESA